VVCAYHCNVDMVHQLNLDLFAEACADGDLGEDDAPPPAVMETPEDVLHAVRWCFLRGAGGEWQLSSQNLQDWVEERFPGYDSLGGTSAIAANHLAALGFAPVLHTPTRGRRLMELLDTGIRFADSLKLVSPAEYVDAQQRDPVHVIIQFEQGELLKVPGKQPVSCPKSNRVIFSYDRSAAFLPIDPGFRSWLKHAGDPPAGGIWCGYNLLSPEVLKYRIPEIEADIANVSGAGGVHHFEASDARNRQVRQAMYQQMLHSRPSIGMNEEEFALLLDWFGIDAPQGVQAGEYMKALRELAGKMDADTVILHTGLVAIGVSRVLGPEQLSRVLAAGVLTASVRARTGGFVTERELRTAAELPAEHLWEFERHREQDYSAASVPTLDFGKVRCSIGLGDSFTAGLTAEYIRLAEENRTLR